MRANNWVGVALPSSRSSSITKILGYTYVASYPGVLKGGGGGGGGERTPRTHCLRMRLISEISRKIGYSSNLPCNFDVIFN